MKKKTVRIIALLLALAMMCTLFTVPASAAKQINAASTGIKVEYTPSTGKTYNVYLEENADIPAATEEFRLEGANYSSESNSGAVKYGEYNGKNNVLCWDSEDGSVTYTVNAPQTAFYNIAVTYCAVGTIDTDPNFGLKIDGEYPFDEADTISLPRMWVNKTDVRKDDFGNQFAPEQKSYDGYVTKNLYDISGVQVFAYDFALTAGQHTVTFEIKYGCWAISEIALTVPESSVPAYEDLSKTYDSKGYKAAEGEVIKIEGENADIKSTSSLIPLSDNASTLVTPSSATSSLVNYIGFTNWKTPNEEITWIIDVPSDGLYKLGTVYKQASVINGSTYRVLKIDGQIPFKEASNLAFPYVMDWTSLDFADKEGNPYLFYLTKGKHELSLTVTLGETAGYYNDLKELSNDLNDLYLDIIMITGESPDENRDYELFKAIPGFEDILADCIARLDDVVNQVREMTGETTNSFISSMLNLTRVMQNIIDNRFDSQDYLQDYYSNLTTVSSWLYDMRTLPVCIDQIQLSPADASFDYKTTSFIEKFKFGVERFLVSFSSSYSKLCIIEDTSNCIKIWITWGRDQAQVLSSLIQESFTPSTGISVNLELVTAGIINGMLAGNAPDLTLHLSRSSPVNYAMRGALVDLTQFDDYEEVIKAFGDSATLPYKYKDGVYALPDTQSYYILFYRKDIFSELGLSIPTTWDEFLSTTAILQRSNMNSYLPYTKISSAGTVDAGVGALNLFGTILMQNGGGFYDDNLTQCQLNSAVALSSFTYWTDMYTKYKVPTQASFYNRFRTGVVPLGVCGYTEYTTLLEAAPEISDLWGISLVPGTIQEDGTIDRTISGSGSGCSILSTSEVPEKAWEFLKWWTSADTQTRYNNNVESILGAVSRISTANIEAFSNFAWNHDDLEIMLEQRSYISEVPEIPGSYYTSRSVDQAFWAVVNGKSTPKDALEQWAKEANNEIKRKIEEYSKLGGEQ